MSSSITKVKEKTIIECLNTLSNSELEKKYENIPQEFKPKKKKVTLAEKKDIICEYILSEFIAKMLFFKEKDLEHIKNLIAQKQPLEQIDPEFLASLFVFKEENTYIVPTELKELYNQIIEKGVQEEKCNLAMNFYLRNNGVLDINKLLELLEYSGFSLTKSKLLKIIKTNEDYIVKKDLIYFNELALSIDKNEHIHQQKQQQPYHEYTLEEIMAYMILEEQLDYSNEISKILAKQVKNKNRRNDISDMIYNTVRIGYNYSTSVYEILDDLKVNLSKEEKEKLEELMDEIYDSTPSWELNGYCGAELYNNEDSTNEIFEQLPLEEQIQFLIHAYLEMNGVIEIEILRKILKEEHHLDFSRKKIIDYAHQIEGIKVTGKYLHVDGMQQEDIKNITQYKDQLDKYKVIDNIDEFLDEQNEIVDRIVDLGARYNVAEEAMDNINSFMYLGFFNDEILKEILSIFNVKMLPKQYKTFLKELIDIQKNMRLWSLNGYKKSELVALNSKKSEKIGRNDLCPCGSGLKYKKCCGK